MSTIVFPSLSHSPETMLLNIARDHGKDLKNVLVIGFAEDGEEFVYTTTGDIHFLATAQLVAQHMALSAIRGELEVV